MKDQYCEAVRKVLPQFKFEDVRATGCFGVGNDILYEKEHNYHTRTDEYSGEIIEYEDNDSFVKAILEKEWTTRVKILAEADYGSTEYHEAIDDLRNPNGWMNNIMKDNCTDCESEMAFHQEGYKNFRLQLLESYLHRDKSYGRSYNEDKLIVFKGSTLESKTKLRIAIDSLVPDNRYEEYWMGWWRQDWNANRDYRMSPSRVPRSQEVMDAFIELRAGNIDRFPRNTGRYGRWVGERHFVDYLNNHMDEHDLNDYEISQALETLSGGIEELGALELWIEWALMDKDEGTSVNTRFMDAFLKHINGETSGIYKTQSLPTPPGGFKRLDLLDHLNVQANNDYSPFQTWTGYYSIREKGDLTAQIQNAVETLLPDHEPCGPQEDPMPDLSCHEGLELWYDWTIRMMDNQKLEFANDGIIDAFVAIGKKYELGSFSRAKLFSYFIEKRTEGIEEREDILELEDELAVYRRVLESLKYSDEQGPEAESVNSDMLEMFRNVQEEVIMEQDVSEQTARRKYPSTLTAERTNNLQERSWQHNKEVLEKNTT
jgi:hypothetical protein